MSYYISKNNFQKRYESTLRRISYLSTLRKEVGLSEIENIDENQWTAIQLPLSEVENKLKTMLKVHARKYIPFLHKPTVARKMNSLLGKIDLDITNSIVFFDTYMDILSQRKMPVLGKILKGCDRLAADAMSVDHPISRELELPIVSCERGFGALIIRPGVNFPGNIKNPVPLIQIPYSRIVSKYDLTSINHEAGHDMCIRLGLNYTIPAALGAALKNAHAPKEIIKLFVLWSSEIGPDFWGFCNTGIAQTLSIKEMLSLPPYRVFHIPVDDPHPAIYIRILLSIEWCRQEWGRGKWDYWEKEWNTLYPLELTSKKNAEILKNCRTYIPIVAKTLLYTRFNSLEGKRISELFDMSALHPNNLDRIVRTSDTGTLDLKFTRPCLQLAVFRLLRHKKQYSEEVIDRAMSEWLTRLGQTPSVTVSSLKSVS